MYSLCFVRQKLQLFWSIDRLTQRDVLRDVLHALMFWGRLVTSNGGRIYEHAIKRVVVGLIPLKLDPKRFWKKGNLVKIKRNNLKWYISSYLCPKMIYQVGKKQCSNSGRKRNDIAPLESDFMVQPPSLLEFPGPLTPPPPWNFQFPPWWGSGYFLEPHNLDISGLIYFEKSHLSPYYF